MRVARAHGRAACCIVLLMCAMTMDRTAPTVIVIGDVITDLVVQLRQALVVASDTASTISTRPGGSGANQAAWLAYIAPQLNVHFVGCVGQDPFGAYHDAELRRSGVLPHLGVDPQRSTGTIVVLVDGDGERSMLTDRGANLGLRVEDLPTEVFQPGACLHLSGYTLADPRTRTVARTAIGLARDHAMIVSVDPASASLLREVGPDRFLAWTRGADLCFPNLDEGRLLSGETDPAAVARSLCVWYGGVALKLGAQGALWARGGEPTLSQTALPITVVDSTGAGDAFCAGFLASWLGGRGAENALAAGIRLGGMAAPRVGARPSASLPAT